MKKQASIFLGLLLAFAIQLSAVAFAQMPALFPLPQTGTLPLGRMPSAVGYQPNLATEMGELQERITSTKRGSITSVQAGSVRSSAGHVHDLLCPLDVGHRGF